MKPADGKDADPDDVASFAPGERVGKWPADAEWDDESLTDTPNDEDFDNGSKDGSDEEMMDFEEDEE